ncbi:hypothetical protein N7520_004610 [Penicillium odoratum]|uniref:uncharacterized protein n=1 Tax=Penicillium odoratum TaxID=1167516 RepID=UPI002546BDB2|nr:uncharacterized protein N7520_004610 [Penicillium odoratum]KAJ5765051.1 hypothetical protein N7520_004610 [Penicillium odoratum]
MPKHHTLIHHINPTKIPTKTLESWKLKGVRVCAANYDDPSSLERVLAGTEATNLISTWVFDRRHEQA